MSYVAILDQVPPAAGHPRAVWSPDLFSTVDGSYQIGNAGSDPVHYPAPFSYYAGSKLAQVEGQIPWAGSGSVVEPGWYSGALAVDPAFTALPDWFSTAAKSDPSSWDSLVLTCVQACLVTLTGTCSLAATCPSPWLQAWQRARHQREGAPLKEVVGGGSRQGGGAVSLTGSLSESFLVAVGDAFDLSAAVEPFGGGGTPTTTVSDWHGAFNLRIAPLPDGTGILSVTCANQVGHSSGTNPRLITSYDAAAFEAPVTTDEAGQTPLLVEGQPLVLHVTPGAYPPARSLCPLGSYYLQPPATVTGTKTTETVYTSGGQDSSTSASGTFSLSPRPVAITVTAGGLTHVALQAGGFTS